MIDIFEDTLSIDAGCPSDISINTNTQIQAQLTTILSMRETTGLCQLENGETK